MTPRQLTAIVIIGITLGYAIVFLSHQGIRFMIDVHTAAARL